MVKWSIFFAGILIGIQIALCIIRKKELDNAKLILYSISAAAAFGAVITGILK